jgi:hypothetical protein
VQSVPITTKFVSSNPVHGEVYSIQHYAIKFVGDLQQAGDFLHILQFSPPIKMIAKAVFVTLLDKVYHHFFALEFHHTFWLFVCHLQTLNTDKQQKTMQLN